MLTWDLFRPHIFDIHDRSDQSCCTANSVVGWHQFGNVRVRDGHQCCPKRLPPQRSALICSSCSCFFRRCRGFSFTFTSALLAIPTAVTKSMPVAAAAAKTTSTTLALVFHPEQRPLIQQHWQVEEAHTSICNAKKTDTRLAFTAQISCVEKNAIMLWLQRRHNVVLV